MTTASHASRCGVVLEEARQVRGADFLLALDDEHHVRRERAVLRQQRLHRLDVQVHLTLVVHGAAGEQVAVAHLRLERRALPLLQRLRGLHVVVAVDEQRGRALRRAAPLAQHHGVPRRGDDLHGEPGLAHALRQPLGGARGVVLVLALGAHAGDAEPLLELGEVLVAVALQKVCRGHRSRSVVGPRITSGGSRYSPRSVAASRPGGLASFPMRMSICLTRAP